MNNFYNQYTNLLHEKTANGYLPVWQVNGENFYNKLDAALHAKNVNSYVHFNFLEGQFDNIDWSVDTDTSEVYVNRLQQIRDKYDVVRLMYSGGADSKLILDTAYENNIPFDYIVLFRGGPLPNSRSDAEIARAEKHIDKYLEKFPKTKLVKFLFDFAEFEKYYSLSPEEWAKVTGHYDYCDRPQVQSWQYLGSSYSEFFWDPYLKGLSHCDLTGKEPPHISTVNNEYVWFFNDVNVDHHYTPFCEWFYISPDMPEVHRYQCHQTKKFLQQNNLFSTQQMSPEQTVACKIYTGKQLDDSYILDCHLKGMNKGILGLWECSQNGNQQVVDNMMRRAAFFKEKFTENELSTGFPRINLVGCISNLYSLQDSKKIINSGDPSVQQIFRYPKNTTEHDEFNNSMQEPWQYLKKLWKEYNLS